MPKVLTADQVARYRNDGFLFPFDLYTPEEAAGLHAKSLAAEEKIGEELQQRFRIKAHLPFPWLCDIVRNPRLLDAVEDLIGPNILCWGASFFAKKAHDPRYVSWHTDSFNYAFEPAETLSAWVSFNNSTIEAGCIKYMPGTHKGPPAVHEFKPNSDNLVGYGQTVVGVDESKAVDAVLRAGQVVFHHESIVHGSGPNRSDHPRVGFVVHYVPTHVRDTRLKDVTAMLVRGEDKYGYWGRDPEPKEDFDPVCIATMQETRARFRAATKDKVTSGITS